MVPVCDKRYHIYKRFRHFWAEIKKLWNYPLSRWRFRKVNQAVIDSDGDPLLLHLPKT